MISAKEFENYQDMLRAAEAENGDRVLIRYMEDTEVREITAPVFFQAVRACAARLDGLGGKHVGLLGRSRWEWLVSFCAVLSIGAVAVLMAESDSAEELLRNAARTDTKVLLYDEEQRDKMGQNGLTEKLTCIPMFSRKDCCPSARYPVCRREREDAACILFTSGTTAEKKAVVLSHRALMEGECNNIIGCDFTAQLAVLPFYHLAGFNVAMNTICLGKTLCIAEDARYLYRCLEAMKPDYLLAVPSMAKVIARRLKRSDDYGASLGWNLRFLACGGAKFQPEILDVLVSRRIAVIQSYGASELGGIGFAWSMTLGRPDTIGKAPEGMETKIEDGELLVRSASLMSGYYDDLEATRQVLKNGWYCTGDLCREDEDGYLYLTGRKDNLIVLSNGENISPEQLETRLNKLEQVAEVMVTSERDFLSGIFVPQYPDGCTEKEKTAVQEAIRSAVLKFNESVPPFLQIQFVHFREQPFARNAMGKMIRHGQEEKA